MAILNTLRLSQLEDEFRLDAQYYTPDKMLLEKEIEMFPTILLGRVALVTDGQHGYFKLDEKSSIRQITAKCIKEGLVDKSKADRLSSETHNKNLRSSLAPNDVLVTTAGTIGQIGIVTVDVPPANIDQDIGRIAIHDQSVSPLFVWAFLQSKFGRFQIDRFTTGQVQTHLSLKKMKKLRLPLLSKHEDIEGIVSKYIQLKIDSAVTCQKAQQLLEAELGLDKLTFQKPVGYSARFSAVQASLRVDSEHFYPEFEYIKSRTLKKDQFVTLGKDLVFCRRGKQPFYGGTGLPVINSKHVQINQIILEGNRTAVRNPVRDFNIRKNDLLINGTGVGTIGRASAYLADSDAVPDNHVTILRPRNLDPVYLSVFLNSSLGQSQVRKHQRGSSGQLELYPYDISKFLVWQAPEAIQLQIRKFIEHAHEAHRRSLELLEQARSRVEQLIEEAVRS